MKYYIFLAGLCLAACNNSTAPASKDSIVPVTVADSVVPFADTPAEEPEYAVDTFTRIVFREFKVTMYPMEVDREEQAKLDQPPTDTAFMVSDIGQTLYGTFITVTSELLTDIKVEEQVETSMAINYDEGFYVLSDWKHGYSPWEELEKNEKGQYIAKTYGPEEGSVFPAATIDELKAAITASGGDASMISEVKTLKDELLDVFPETFFIRVTGKRKDNGEIVTKIIEIYLPIGC